MKKRTIILCALIAIVLLALLRGCQPQKPIKSLVVYTTYLPMVTKPFPSPKRGITISWGSDYQDATFINAAWGYNWWIDAPVFPNGAEGVPMMSTADAVEKPINGSSDWLMGFNEPNESSQSNITPSQSVPLWHRIEERFPDKELLAPAPSQTDPAWIVDFRNDYIQTYGYPPRLDGLAAHCYVASALDCEALIQWYIDRANEWGVPEVWLTEFAYMPCTTSPRSPLTESNSLIDWMERNPKVTRYAWYTNRQPPADPCWSTALFDWYTGSITVYGTMYRDSR